MPNKLYHDEEAMDCSPKYLLVQAHVSLDSLRLLDRLTEFAWDCSIFLP